jgi:hypothetical protein
LESVGSESSSSEKLVGERSGKELKVKSWASSGTASFLMTSWPFGTPKFQVLAVVV